MQVVTPDTASGIQISCWVNLSGKRPPLWARQEIVSCTFEQNGCAIDAADFEDDRCHAFYAMDGTSPMLTDVTM